MCNNLELTKQAMIEIHLLDGYVLKLITGHSALIVKCNEWLSDSEINNKINNLKLQAMSAGDDCFMQFTELKDVPLKSDAISYETTIELNQGTATCGLVDTIS